MQMVQQINLMQILEPTCKTAYSRPVESITGKRRTLEENYEGFLAALESPALWCRVILEILCILPPAAISYSLKF